MRAVNCQSTSHLFRIGYAYHNNACAILGVKHVFEDDSSYGNGCHS